jgi:alpha-beta hydrolase superfamily lysophospholipase
MESRADETIIEAADGHKIRLRSFAPAGACGGIIQVLHGMGEHGARYDRFARVACERGFAVMVHDHRGHGEHADIPGHFADADGWNLVVTDGLAVLASARERFAGRPLVLLGHSMGSFLAQHVAMRASDALTGLILSASTRPRRAELLPGWLVTRLAMLRYGPRGKSPLLDRLGFDGFNRPVRPTTGCHAMSGRSTATPPTHSAAGPTPALCGEICSVDCGRSRRMLRYNESAQTCRS